MELSRQEYPALLVSSAQIPGQPRRRGLQSDNTFQTSLSPNQAVTVLNDRVTLIGKINHDIAEWLAVGIAAQSRENETKVNIGAKAYRGHLRSKPSEALPKTTTWRRRPWVYNLAQ